MSNNNKIIEYLTKRNLLKDNLLITYYSGLPVLLGGLIGGISAEMRRWYISTNGKSLFIFKINNLFSFGGIKEDTLREIPFYKIEKIDFNGVICSEHGHWTAQNKFIITTNNETIKGTMDVPGEEKIFEAIKTLVESHKNLQQLE